MNKINQIWDNFKNSKIGWGVIVTAFAVSFALLVSILTGIFSLPVIFNEGFEFTDEVVSVIFPITTILSSVYVARLLIKRKKSKLDWKSIKDILGWKKPKKNALWLTPVLSAIYFILLILSLIILEIISPQLAGQEQAVAQTVSNSTSWSLVIMVFAVGILTPIAEETIFRGLLLNLYSRKIKIVSSIVIVSILFGLAHGQVNVGIDTFLFGITLGILTWKTESIAPAVFLHMLKNCLAVVFLLNS